MPTRVKTEDADGQPRSFEGFEEENATCSSGNEPSRLYDQLSRHKDKPYRLDHPAAVVALPMIIFL